MKVAVLTRDYPPKVGGIATHASALIRHLRMLGVHVDVYAGYNDFKTLFLPLFHRFKEYDLVHVQSSPYGAFVRKHPLVVTVHAPVMIEKQYYTRGLKLRSYPAITLEKSTLRRASAILAVSETTKRDLAASYEVETERIFVIGNGVEYDEFCLEKSEPTEKARILLVSRLEPRKNIDEALVALSKIPPSLYTARIVGSGSQMNRLKRRTLDLNVDLEFLGEIAESELPAVYRDADIFLSTSRSEGFGVSVLEAMASGCAVLVSSLPTHEALIVDGENGLLYSDTDELHSKLRALITSRELVRKLGRSAKETARKYSWDTVAEKVLEVYQRLLEYKV